MRILFVTYDGEASSGAKLLCYDYAEQLRMLGHESGVFSFKDTLGARFEGAESCKSTFAERLKLIIVATIKMLKIDNKTVLIVHKAGYHSLAAVITSILKGNKIVMFYDDFEYYDNPVKNIFFYLLLKKSSACIAVSKYLQKFLSYKTPKRVIYVPGGTETDIFKPMPIKKNRDITFVWVGFVDNKETLKKQIPRANSGYFE